MRSLKESLIGNIKRSSLNDGSDIKNLKQKLDSPDFLKKIIFECLQFVDGQQPDDIVIGKNREFVRLYYKNFPNKIIKMVLDAGLWDQYKLPKQFYISKFKSKNVLPHGTIVYLGLKNSKGGNIENFVFDFGEPFYRSGVLFIDGVPNKPIKIQNCTFESPVIISCVENLYIDGRFFNYNHVFNYVEKEPGDDMGYYLDWKGVNPMEVIGKNYYKKENNMVQIMVNYSKVRQYDTYSRVNEILRKKYDFGDPNIKATFST